MRDIVIVCVDTGRTDMTVFRALANIIAGHRTQLVHTEPLPRPEDLKFKLTAKAIQPVMEEDKWNRPYPPNKSPHRQY